MKLVNPVWLLLYSSTAGSDHTKADTSPTVVIPKKIFLKFAMMVLGSNAYLSQRRRDGRDIYTKAGMNYRDIIASPLCPMEFIFPLHLE